MNITEALDYGKTSLLGGDSPELDSQVLLCHVLACSTTYLHAWTDKVLTQQQQTEFEHLISLRQQQDTLVPRPDTELLVSLALTKIKADMLIADLGTGSGAIALSLAAEMSSARFVAMDYSLPALKVAVKNATNNDLNNVCFWQGSWLSAISDNSLDIVVSNPPYIEENDPHLTVGDVQFEPITALTSGADGLDDIRLIISQAARSLKPSGWLMIEHGYHQAQQVKSLFEQAGFTSVSSEQDYGGNDRVVLGQLPL